MRYLEINDLTADIYERFINELAENPQGNEEAPILNDLEGRAIALASTYLSGRYDVAKIFDADEPVRNELLVDVLSRIVVYRLVKRNKARSANKDLKEDYDAAIKTLEKINSGATKLNDLPKITDENGNTVNKLITGNLSNPDFYI